eukprot:gnl/TRDRNA2_/TRDRNA2_186951_c0_seq1.p1 gnl/TRDRNA2_/TRDRNA2_186951_c0~~gnl/TRDRNA2_/TRDRNA2_186951_c0_seq1.p1  ORF type:complete len:220 (-),score=60.29 gnl/TRDRNA2_/TRDRNA2_186951_c0_seq1:60-719(-)
MMRTLCSLVLLLSLPAAAVAAGADADASSDAMSDAVMNDPGVQGAMLLSAALPHHGAPPPKELLDEMDKAGPLVYSAYEMLQTASGSLEAVNEQLKTGLRGSGSISSDIAIAEQSVQRAAEKLKQGNSLRQSAEATFQNNADPLGDPPEAPKSWANVDAMASRTQNKLGLVKQQATEAKRLAQGKGISLISVDQEKSTVLADNFDKQTDDKLLDWLDHY